MLLDHDRDEEQRALGEKLIEGRHAQQNKPVVERPDDHDTQEGAEDRAGASAQAAAAQETPR